MTRMCWTHSSYVSASVLDSDSSDGELTDMGPEDSLALGVAALSIISRRLPPTPLLPLELWSMPPDRRRSTWLKLDPRVEVVAWPWYGTAGRGGYATAAAAAAELCREPGDMPDDEALGEWPEVYDMEAEGGVTAGVPVEWVDDSAVRAGEAAWAADTAAYGSTEGRIA